MVNTSLDGRFSRALGMRKRISLQDYPSTWNGSFQMSPAYDTTVHVLYGRIIPNKDGTKI